MNTLPLGNLFFLNILLLISLNAESHFQNPSLLKDIQTSNDQASNHSILFTSILRKSHQSKYLDQGYQNRKLYQIRKQSRPAQGHSTNSAKKLKTSERSKNCRMPRKEHDLGFMVYKTPTLVRGRIVERLELYETKYTFLVRINMTYKKNEEVINNEDKNLIQRFSSPLNIKMKKNLRLSSYIFVDGIRECGKDDLQLNQNYYFFLERVTNTSTIHHPIKLRQRPKKRVNIKRTNLIKIKSGKSSIVVADLQRKFNSIKPKMNSPEILSYPRRKVTTQVKVPLVPMRIMPIMQDSTNVESVINKTLCLGCARRVNLRLDKKIHRANIDQNVKIFCEFDGNPAPEIFWKKHGKFGKINNTNKYSIEKIKNFSILTIKSVMFNDTGVYYCAARDYVSGGKLKVVKTNLITQSFGKSRFFRKKYLDLHSQVSTRLVQNPTTQRPTKSSNASDIRIQFSHIPSKKTRNWSQIKRPNPYVSCRDSENVCLNGGSCLKTNPELKSLFPKMFCRCSREFDGPNCEIKIVTSVLNFDPKDIPIELKALWLSLGNNKKVRSKNPADE